jgi:hypothetical protein
MTIYSHSKGWEANYYAQVVSQIIKYDPAIVAMDANVSPDVLGAVIQHCNAVNITSESLAPEDSQVLNLYLIAFLYVHSLLNSVRPL